MERFGEPSPKRLPNGIYKFMKLRYTIATFLYCAGIFWMSSRARPINIDLPTFEGLDKIVHFVLYAGLCALVSIGLRRSETKLTGLPLFWIPIAFAALYGLTDEIHQLFVPQRSFELLDLIADFAGAVSAQALLHYAWNKNLLGQLMGKLGFAK